MEKKTERIDIRVSPKKKAEIKKQADDRDMSMSAYLLSQLVEPEWVSKIKVREGRPPSTSIWHPSPPPPSIRKKRVEDIVGAVGNANMIRELKQILFNGVDEFFKPHEEVYHEDIKDRGKNILIDAHNKRIEEEKKRLLKEAPKRKLPAIPGGK